jgi:hypothetical protein
VEVENSYHLSDFHWPFLQCMLKTTSSYGEKMTLFWLVKSLASFFQPVVHVDPKIFQILNRWWRVDFWGRVENPLQKLPRKNWYGQHKRICPRQFGFYPPGGGRGWWWPSNTVKKHFSLKHGWEWLCGVNSVSNRNIVPAFILLLAEICLNEIYKQCLDNTY